MKRPITIGIDLDGSLAAYQESIVRLLNKHYKKSCNLKNIKRDDCYDILGNNIISRALKLKKFYSDSNALMKIKPVNGAAEVIKKFQKKGFELFIVTSRFRGFKRNTDKWLDQKFGKKTFKRVVYSNILASYSRSFKAAKYAKWAPDYVIEDSAYVAKKCSKRGIKVFLLDYPWNKKIKMKNIIRVKNWNEIPKKLK
jgi:uncharacterized HAD superfamily protein